VNGLNVYLVGLSNVLLVFEGHLGSFPIGMVRLFGWPTVCTVKGRFFYLVPNESASHLGNPQSERLDASESGPTEPTTPKVPEATSGRIGPGRSGAARHVAGRPLSAPTPNLTDTPATNSGPACICSRLSSARTWTGSRFRSIGHERCPHQPSPDLHAAIDNDADSCDV
jgi:hypothetical protein